MGNLLFLFFKHRIEDCISNVCVHDLKTSMLTHALCEPYMQVNSYIPKSTILECFW